MYLAYDIDRGRDFAVKEIPLLPEEQQGTSTSKELQSLECDMGVLRTLTHERIVRYYGHLRDTENFLVFMEYMPGV